MNFPVLVFRRGQPKRCYGVADYAQNGNLDTLMAIMKYNGGYLNTSTAKSLLDVRAFLECPALEALAAHHTQEDIAKLEQLLAENLQGKGRWHPCPFTGDVPLSPHDHFFKWKYHYTSDPQRFFSGRTFLLGGLYPDRRRGCLARTVRTLFRLYPKRKRERAG